MTNGLHWAQVRWHHATLRCYDSRQHGASPPSPGLGTPERSTYAARSRPSLRMCPGNLSGLLEEARGEDLPAGEPGCRLLGLSLSASTHRKGVASSPRHLGCCDTQLPHRLFTGLVGQQLQAWLRHCCGNDFTWGVSKRHPHFPGLPNILTWLHRMASVPGQMFEDQCLSALARAGRGRGSAQSDSV